MLEGKIVGWKFMDKIVSCSENVSFGWRALFASIDWEANA